MDYSKVCRSCMKTVEESENPEANLLDMYNYCTRLKIRQDCKLPKVFCKYCTKAIKCSYSFIRKAHWIDDKLKALIPNSVTTVIVNPDKSKEEVLSDLDDFDDRHFTKDDDIMNADDKSNIKVEKLEFEVKCKKNNKVKKKIKKKFTKPKSKLKNENPVRKSIRERKPVSRLKDCVITDVNNGDDDDFDDRDSIKAFDDGNSNDINDTDDKSNIKVEEIKTLSATEETETAKVKNSTPVRKSLREKKTVIPKEELKIEYSCKICLKHFEKELWLRKHIPTFHPEIKDIHGNMVIKATNSEKMEENVYFNNKGKRVYGCPLCKKEFVAKAPYYKHMKNKKAGDDKRTCKICKKVLKTPCHLSSHTYQVHQNKPKFECNVCKKKFRIKDNCVRHKDTHKEIEPISCDECNAEFRTVHDYSVHKNTHKAVIKPEILCDLCGKTCDSERSLQVHMFKHTREQPLQCVLCPFKTAYPSAMRVHKLRHEGLRKKLCSFCPKSFYEAASLERHLRYHTGERPFRCPYCELGFIDSWKRKSHIMHKHNLAFDDIPSMDKQGNAKPKMII